MEYTFQSKNPFKANIILLQVIEVIEVIEKTLNGKQYITKKG